MPVPSRSSRVRGASTDALAGDGLGRGPAPAASALFLREAEVRRGLELLFFGYSNMTRPLDERLAGMGLGRAHHRALYFVARQPGISVGELLAILGITKQSLGRVLQELGERELVQSRPGESDRRRRCLELTPAGRQLESDLFEALRSRLSAAYAHAGQEAVTGFWRVLEGLAGAAPGLSQEPTK